MTDVRARVQLIGYPKVRRTYASCAARCVYRRQRIILKLNILKNPHIAPSSLSGHENLKRYALLSSVPIICAIDAPRKSALNKQWRYNGV